MLFKSSLALAAMVVAAASSAVPSAADGVAAVAELRSRMRATSVAQTHPLRLRRQASPNVEINGTNYTSYGSCLTAADEQMNQMRQLFEGFRALIPPEEMASVESMMASLDTCPVGFSAMMCIQLSDSCKSVDVENMMPDDSPSASASELQATFSTVCGAASMGCMSYYFSVLATIAANPTSCAFAHNHEAEDSDSCSASTTVVGPRVGNNNVSVGEGTTCISCSNNQVVRINDVFYGQRDAAGHATCASTTVEDRLEDHCDGKPTCSFNHRSSSSFGLSNMYEITLPATVNGYGSASCSGNSNATDFQVEFTCVSPATLSMFSDETRIRHAADQVQEYMCVKDNSGQYCGSWHNENLQRGIFTNVTYHGGHLSAGQCQAMRDSGSCCWASFIDQLAVSQPASDAAANANEESVYRAVVSSCANHGIPVSTVVGTWEGQNEHCGTAASIAAGTGGTAAEHTISVDSSTSTKSSSQALAPSMLLAVALAFFAM